MKTTFFKIPRWGDALFNASGHVPGCLFENVCVTLHIRIYFARNLHEHVCEHLKNSFSKIPPEGDVLFDAFEHVPDCLFDNARKCVSFLIFVYFFRRAAWGSNQNHEKHNFQKSQSRVINFSIN